MENQNANPQGSRNQENENSIQIKDIIFLIISNWYWFVISALACLIIASVVYKTISGCSIRDAIFLPNVQKFTVSMTAM